MKISIARSEPILRDNKCFASKVGFNIGGSQTKVSIHDDFLTQRLGRVPDDIKSAIWELESTICALLRQKLEDNPSIDNLEILPGE